MQRGLSQFPQTRELSASQLKRGIFLFRGGIRAKIEPDGSMSWLYSAHARKLVFGRISTEVFKIQAGVKIGVRSQDVILRTTPTGASYSPRGVEKIQAVHSVRLLHGECEGWVRAVTLTNRTDAVARLRVLTLHDPTSLNFRRDRDAPGEIGVNAFNRQDQVVMDDVGDTTGVRVIGFSSRPSVIYMTKDRSRAAELLSLGELPESSLGMSGSVIIMTQQGTRPPAWWRRGDQVLLSLSPFIAGGRAQRGDDRSGRGGRVWLGQSSRGRLRHLESLRQFRFRVGKGHPLLDRERREPGGAPVCQHRPLLAPG